MGKLIICTFVFITGCASSIDSLSQKKFQQISYTFNKNTLIQMQVPEGGSSIMPALQHDKILTKGISIRDIKNTESKVLWLEKLTYLPIRFDFISGKYTIGLAISSVFQSENQILNSDEALEKYLITYYKKNFQIDRSFKIKNFNSNSWITHNIENNEQNILTAFSILDNNHFIILTFDFSGASGKEYKSAIKISERILRSVSISD